jgi:hypothetical protein
MLGWDHGNLLIRIIKLKEAEAYVKGGEEEEEKEDQEKEEKEKEKVEKKEKEKGN